MNIHDLNNASFDNITLLRGALLSYIIDIERKFDDFISRHFCATLDKKNELDEMLLFTEKISLDTKRQLFIGIFKKHYAKDADAKDFLNSIEELVAHRNIFAHLEVLSHKPGVSLEDMDTIYLSFKKYSNGKLKPKEYSQHDIMMIMLKIATISEVMDRILTDLPPLV